MRIRFVSLVVLGLVLATGWTVVHARSKPAPAIPNWQCEVTLRDAPGDMILSDTPAGAAPRAYIDGVDGVLCQILIKTARTTTGSGSGFDSRSPRYMLFPGQSNSTGSYITFLNRFSFEVKTIADVPWTGAPYVDVMPFRAWVADAQFQGGAAKFRGDSNFTGGDDLLGTSSVFVEPLDPCSWRVTSYTTEDTSAIALTSGERPGTQTDPTRVMQLSDQKGKNLIILGSFPMPFGAEVKVFGNKAGCGG